MLEALSERLRQTEVYKIDIGFNINKKNMDNLIGRTAHILFLQNEVLMKMLIYRYSNLFK